MPPGSSTHHAAAPGGQLSAGDERLLAAEAVERQHVSVISRRARRSGPPSPDPRSRPLRWRLSRTLSTPAVPWATSTPSTTAWPKSSSRSRAGARAQMLLFSFFRRTLSYLESASGSSYNVDGWMDGRMRDERERIIEEFREGSFQILLSPRSAPRVSTSSSARARQLRPAVEPDAGGAADRPARPVRPGATTRSSSQLLDPRHDRDRHLRAALRPDRDLRRLDRRAGADPRRGDARAREAASPIRLSPGSGPTGGTDRPALSVSKKVQLEQFEETRSRLIGHDDYVVEQLDELEQQRRYITPEELERLFRGFLDREVGGKNHLLEDSSTPGLFHATMSGRFMISFVPTSFTMGLCRG